MKYYRMNDAKSTLFDCRNFRSHIQSILKLLEEDIPFAFNRISDGELFILQGKAIELGERGALIDGVKVNQQRFSRWDQKSFDPDRDRYIAAELPKTLHSTNPLYLLGLPCPCCCNIGDVERIRRVSSANQTWANLLVNGNYKYFIEEVFPCIQDKRVMAAVNHQAKVDAFSSCNAFKHFKIPDNVIQKAPFIVDEFIDQCSVLEDRTVVLVGASVVAKIMIHKAFSMFPNLTFIDIGTTLNPLLGLGLGRDYLRGYWLGATNRSVSPYARRQCVWDL